MAEVITDEQRHANRRAEMRATNEAMAALMQRIADRLRTIEGAVQADIDKFDELAKDIEEMA